MVDSRSLTVQTTIKQAGEGAGEEHEELMERRTNGPGARAGARLRPVNLVEEPAPGPVADLAEGCVRFVEKALGVRLDYTPETLPVLDHYLAEARGDAAAHEETLDLLAQAGGAYFGEVIRRKHPSWWRMDSDDPMQWRVELEAVYLAFSPMLFVREALLRPVEPEAAEERPRDEDDEEEEDEDADEPEDREPGLAAAVSGAAMADAEGGAESEAAPLILEEEDRWAVSARLAELPPVTEAEYYATSTRLEVIDIAVEEIRSRRMAEGEEEYTPLEPADYTLDD